jgi:hypothetical protein
MGTINGATGSLPSHYKYWIEWVEDQINEVNNTSRVTATVYVQKISYYSVEGSANSHTLYIDGTPFTANPYIDMNPETTPRAIVSGSKTITHTSNGSKSISISSSGQITYIIGATYSPQSGSAGATVALTTIPREAYVTNSVDFEVEDDIPLTITNDGNQYVKAELYVNSTLIKTQELGQVTSATITLDSSNDDDIYAEMPDATSVAMYVRLKTYSDSGYTTQIGVDKDTAGTVTIDQTTNKPTFTTYTLANVDKSIEVRDQDSNLLVTSSTATLLGSSTKMIKGYSEIRATISVANKMVALNSATEDKYRLSTSLQQVEADYSAGSDVELDLDNVQLNSFNLTAFDSRGLSTVVAGSLSYIAEYTPVNIYGLTFVRDNNVDSETKIQFSGEMFNEYFGGGTDGVENAITAHYRYKETTVAWASQTWNSFTPSVDGSGNITFDDYLDGDLGATGFDDEKSFDIQVRVHDKLTVVTLEGTLSRGKPLVDYTQDGVAFNDKYNSGIGGSVQIDGEHIKTYIGKLMYPVGSLYFNADDDTDPATLLGFGTWAAFAEGEVLVGQDTGDSDFDVLEETGGAKTHALTTSEMPSHRHSLGDIRTTEHYTGTDSNWRTKSASSGSSAYTNYSGSGNSHNNLQPYVVVKIWKRTA